MKETKESTPCMDCGKCYPYYVMDFDHLSDKQFSISKIKWQNSSINLKEIKKCEIVCSNCHRERTMIRKIPPHHNHVAYI